MKNERIGNDINIAWEIKSGDSPFPLEGKNVTLYLHHPYGKQKVEGFRLEGNKVIWKFKGADQKYVGKYGLTLVVNEGANGMITTDSCDFVNLVACSCQVGGEDNDGVQTEAIELTSTLGFIAYDDTEIREELSRLETDKADKSELTELSAEVSGLSERIDNLPTAESDVFKAIFGETKIEEIIDAYESGKVVHCDYQNNCYILSRVVSGEAYFTAVYSTISYLIVCNKNSIWNANNFRLEEAKNKVTSLSSSSTDTQYPSAKAVYTAIQQSGVSIVEKMQMMAGTQHFKGILVDGTPYSQVTSPALNDIKIAYQTPINNRYPSMQNAINLEEVYMMFWQLPDNANLNSCFQGCTKLKRADLRFCDTSRIMYFSNLFYGDTALEYIDAKGFSVENASDTMSSNIVPLRAEKLVTLVGDTTIEDVLANNIAVFVGTKDDINMYACPALNRASLRAYINGLKDYSDGESHTFRLDANAYARLTDEDKAVATEKNWTITI